MTDMKPPPATGTQYPKALLAAALIFFSASGLAQAGDNVRLTGETLPDVLKLIPEQVQPGTQVDEITTLRSASASGNVLSMSYTTDAQKAQTLGIEIQSKEDGVKKICGRKTMRQLMKYGAVIEQVYFDLNGKKRDSIRVDQKRCGKYS